MATTVPAVPREDGRLFSIDPDSDYNRYRSQQQEEQVLDYIPPPPSQPPAQGNALNRSRRTQKMGGYLSKLPPPSFSDDSSASFSSNSTSRASSSSSVDDLPPSQPVYILTDNPVPKSKPKTTKGFRSKLSKQYTPSDDESDEEPLGIKILAFPAPSPSPTAPMSPPLPTMSPARSSMFMSGRAVELNSDYGSVSRSDSNFGRGTGTEILRVVSMNDAATPSFALSTTADRMEAAPLSSKTKKLSLMKRMSKLFSNGSQKAARSASTPPLATGTAHLGPSSSTSSRLSLTPSTKGHHKPSMEVLEESPGRQALQPDSHQGLTSVGHGSSTTGMLSLRPSVLSAHRDRNTRDSGFEDAELSMNTGSINSNNVNRPPVKGASQLQQGRFSMLMSIAHSRGNRSQPGMTDQALDPQVGSQRPSMDSDPMWTTEQVHRYQQGQSSQPSQPTFNRHSFSAEMMPPPPVNQNEAAAPRQSADQQQHMRQRSVTAAVTAVLDQAQHRLRQHGGDISQHPLETQRRSSTPLMYSAAPSQTLVSRIDREKSTVCFQSSPSVDAIATKGATSTATTTAATTSRQQPNPAVHKSHQQQIQQQAIRQISPKITAVVSMSGQDLGGDAPQLGVNSPRRDSSGSQETNASSTYTNATTATGVSSVSGVGTGNVNGNSHSISTAKSKAMASYSPGLALQQQVNLVDDTKKSEPRRLSAGSTSKIQSLTQQSKTQQPQQAQQQKPQQQPQQQPHQQKQQQQQQQQQQPPQPATSRQRASPKRQSTAGYFTMPSPALQLQQHNQQLKQLQLQTSPMNTPPLNSPPAPMASMSPSFLNPSSTILSSSGRVGSPHLDPSWALQQQQQQLQQQIELQLQQQYQQNQHMQLQLQLDQLQHLQLQQHQILMQQQQIDKTRAALMVSTSAIATQQHQQQQLFMMPNFMYPPAAASASAAAAAAATVHQAR